MTRIAASTVVPAAPEAVFRFLSDLENHWRLADRWIEPLAINDGSGTVRIHGPLGIRRTATTTVEDAEPSHLIHGTAALSDGTAARISWEMTEDPGGTAVRLSAEVDRSSAFDRLLLTLGGSVWIERRFAAILERLATLVQHG